MDYRLPGLFFVVVFLEEWREITISFWNFLTFKGDLETIKFVKQKFSLDLNQKSAYGFTPLHFAATNGKMGVVRYLTENGANINAKSYSQWTPFHLAARLVRFHCSISKLADYMDLFTMHARRKVWKLGGAGSTVMDIICPPWLR